MREYNSVHGYKNRVCGSVRKTIPDLAQAELTIPQKGNLRTLGLFVTTPGSFFSISFKKRIDSFKKEIFDIRPEGESTSERNKSLWACGTPTAVIKSTDKWAFLAGKTRFCFTERFTASDPLIVKRWPNKIEKILSSSSKKFLKLGKGLPA